MADAAEGLRWCTKMTMTSSHRQEAWNQNRRGGVRQSDARKNGLEHDTFYQAGEVVEVRGEGRRR
jgi:hypothetical protein